jgi:hypothetical protein
MRKKAIGALVLAAALAVTVFGPAALAQVYGQPPSVTPIKGKTKVKKKVPVATIKCGTGSCTTTASAAKIAAPGGGSFTGKVIAPALAAGGSATVKVKLPKAALAAVRAAGKGKVKWSLTESSSTGLSATGSGKRKLKT